MVENTLKSIGEIRNLEIIDLVAKLTKGKESVSFVGF